MFKDWHTHVNICFIHVIKLICFVQKKYFVSRFVTSLQQKTIIIHIIGWIRGLWRFFCALVLIWQDCHNKHGGSKQWKCTVSWLWRLEVWNWGVSNIGSFWDFRRRICSQASLQACSSFLETFHVPWLLLNHSSLPSASHGTFPVCPSMSEFVHFIRTFITTSWTRGPSYSSKTSS